VHSIFCRLDAQFSHVPVGLMSKLLERDTTAGLVLSHPPARKDVYGDCMNRTPHAPAGLHPCIPLYGDDQYQWPRTDLAILSLKAKNLATQRTRFPGGAQILRPSAVSFSESIKTANSMSK
jgi:hypothetical protein